MLRAAGLSYKRFEEAGLMLVVSEMQARYHAAAEFDDVLDVTTEVIEIRKVRIRHGYRIEAAGRLIVEAESTIACVDRDGKLRRLPSALTADAGRT